MCKMKKGNASYYKKTKPKQQTASRREDLVSFNQKENVLKTP